MDNNENNLNQKKKEKTSWKFSVLYKTEYVTYIAFCAAIIAIQIFFYFYYIDGTALIPPSSPENLFPSVVMAGLIVFLVMYLAMRRIYIDSKGVTYKTTKNKYYIAWEDVKYVKITLNGNDRIGRGSYIVLANSEYLLQYTDFRSARDGFIVMRYRHRALEVVKKHYDGEIIRATKK